MIAALRKSAQRFAEFVFEPTVAEPAHEANVNPLEFNAQSIPEEFIEVLIAHYMRPFDGSYVKAFEFPVVQTPCFDALVKIARDSGYHVTHPEDGRSIFALSIDEVEALLCQGDQDEPEIPETGWL